MSDVIQVITTVEQKGDAEKIARALLEKRLAACVQIIGPMTSMYWWQGAIESAGEYQCVVKTSRDLYADLEQALLELHPYEVPEILAVPVVAGGAGYLDWLAGELKK